ncbi:protein disulfide oxidoreductase [Ectothiorhodospiraceae bacterium 2226]|nr:protein disulfide oxidoreductase [Ectothiorhodospiraceae bacterium 2226]
MTETKRKRPFWLKLTVEVLIIVLVIVAIRAYMQRDTVSGRAPPVSGIALSGQPVTLAQYEGEPVLVYFWATWCGVCNLKHGTIERLARDHNVLTVAMQSGDAAEVRAFMAERGIDYPVVVDPQGRIAARYGIRGVPASFVVDGAGDIRFTEIGYTTSWGLRARLWWAGLAG